MVVSEGTIDLDIDVFRAVINIKGLPGITTNALRVIAKLCANEDNSKNLVSSGICELVVKAMHAYRKEDSLWYGALDAIGTLAKDEEYHSRLMEAGIGRLFLRHPFQEVTWEDYKDCNDKLAEAKRVRRCVDSRRET